MTQGRKKNRMESVDLLVDGCILPLRDDNAEEEQHRYECNEEQGSVTMLRLRNEQQRQRKQKRESRRTSPAPAITIARHQEPVCLIPTVQTFADIDRVGRAVAGPYILVAET